jgi:hypothetical protein
MGWSNVNGFELADAGLDAATHWFRNGSASWQKKELPEAAEWIKLLRAFAPGIPEKQQDKISRLAEKAMLEIPAEVKKETKAFAEKLNRLFNSKKQRDIKPEEFYLHALVVLSSEDGFSATDTKAFDALLKAFKS